MSGDQLEILLGVVANVTNACERLMNETKTLRVIANSFFSSRDLSISQNRKDTSIWDS